MKMKQPEPFMFKGDERAVLLLHGFTGHSADVRMLGRYLNSLGYTCYAPIYRGHGKSPEELIDVTADQWWEDVQEAYQYLKKEGYEKIAVAGLSLGGVLGLRLACNNPLQAVVTMCSPMFFDNEEQLTIGFRQFAKEYKQLEKKDDETIQEEINRLLENSKELFKQIAESIERVKEDIDMLYTPAFVVQATNDKMINTESANYIYQTVESDQKLIKWYENAGHAITFSNAKDELHKDIAEFFASLDW
ncbi:abhydrolase domain-containing 18 [Gracilibacillus oryzae]|uniref:Abhydrolase domain-containing 18 n=1 Tax=Gracilibacillus oryzae TaxID=1672701 RepID=A0A7C8GS91_9BACI|nr:alpha/beta fold hydrolase [Gracilibacillus oryzae]KAB8131744.1 abhydrolase domain-containing 18 [Gracilibacillus oryzae]